MMVAAGITSRRLGQKAKLLGKFCPEECSYLGCGFAQDTIFSILANLGNL